MKDEIVDLEDIIFFEENLQKHHSLIKLCKSFGGTFSSDLAFFKDLKVLDCCLSNNNFNFFNLIQLVMYKGSKI